MGREYTSVNAFYYFCLRLNPSVAIVNKRLSVEKRMLVRLQNTCLIAKTVHSRRDRHDYLIALWTRVGADHEEVELIRIVTRP